MASNISIKIKTLFYNMGLAIKSLGWKKDPSVVLVGAWFGEKFADNSRFLYQYLSDNKKQLGLTHVIWVTRSYSVMLLLKEMGYEVCLMDSKESVIWHKKAGYHIICNAFGDSGNLKADILTQYSWRSVKVNLWHGVIGFKAVAMASRDYILNKKQHRILYYFKELLYHNGILRKFVVQLGGWGDCYYLSTSPLKTQLMTNSFRLPRSHYIETGFPRVSGTVRLLPIEERVVEIMKSYHKIVIYLPTFRSYGGSRFDFNEASEGMKEYLEKNNILWIQKVHSASGDKTSEFIQNGNVLTLSHDFDINTIIPYISLMVSDYSSAMGDAMYYYKPIVFYVPDFDDYRNNDRGFQRDPDEIMCGPKARNVAELEKFIDESLADSYRPDEKYISVRNEYYAHEKTLGDIWQDILTATK